MVAPATPQPTAGLRRLFVVDDVGNVLADFTQHPIDGGIAFHGPAGNVVLRITPADDGYCVLTFRDSKPNVLVSVDPHGVTRVERFDDLPDAEGLGTAATHPKGRTTKGHCTDGG